MVRITSVLTHLALLTASALNDNEAVRKNASTVVPVWVFSVVPGSPAVAMAHGIPILGFEIWMNCVQALKGFNDPLFRPQLGTMVSLE
jgi:hypothetical protein